MKRSGLITLAGLAILLWGAWYLFQTEEKTELSIRERRDFFKADSLTVDSIAVRYGNWTHLTKRDGRWDVIFPDWETPADPNILRDVFKFTNEMVLENLISTREEKHQSFKVDTLTGTVLQFFSAGVPEAEFVMGKAGADQHHTFIRQLQSDSVYMARGDFQRVFRRVPTDWGSRVIFDADTSELASIRWITKDEEIRVSREDSGEWLVYRNQNPIGQPVDTSVFNVRLRRVCPLMIDTFAGDATGVAAQTDNPYLQLILAKKSGFADTLLFNHPSESDMRMFAFRPGRPKPLFIMFKGSYDRLSGVYADLVAKNETKRID